MVVPLSERLSHFRQVCAAILDRFHLRLRRDVVDDPLCDVAADTELPKPGAEGPAQIVEHPPRNP